MAGNAYRPAIHTKGAAALTTALAYALANCHELSETDRLYISEFVAKINTKEAVRTLATKLVPSRAVSDEDLKFKGTLDPAELAGLYEPMSKEQLRVREQEQQVKRLGPPSHSATESKPDIERNDTQNRYTD